MIVKDGKDTTELKFAIASGSAAILIALVSLGIISQSESETLNTVLGAAIPVLLLVIGQISTAYTKSRTSIKEAALAGAAE